MFYLKSSIRSARRGFTLIELLVVVSIIGLLSSVVLAALRSARINAANARIKEDVITLRNQIELGYNGSYYSNLNIQYYTVTSSGDAAITNTIADILKQSQGALLGGGIQVSNDGVCGSTYNSDLDLDVAVGSGCSYNQYLHTSNGLSIFTDARCNQPTAYAIYAQLQPIGSGGYFCVDSKKNVVLTTSSSANVPYDTMHADIYPAVPKTDFTSIDSSGAGPQSHC